MRFQYVAVSIAALALLGACETQPVSDTGRFSTPGGAGVYQINANVFEVVGSSSRGASIYWCGASEYARRALGQSWETQISISRTLGPSQATDRTSAVQFTLNPSAVGVTPFRSSFPNQLQVGDTNSVSQANLYCDKLRFPPR